MMDMEIFGVVVFILLFFGYILYDAFIDELLDAIFLKEYKTWATKFLFAFIYVRFSIKALEILGFLQN